VPESEQSHRGQPHDPQENAPDSSKCFIMVQVNLLRCLEATMHACMVWVSSTDPKYPSLLVSYGMNISNHDSVTIEKHVSHI